MFHLSVVIFRKTTTQHLHEIEWAYPISMNSSKYSFAINVCSDYSQGYTC